MNTTTRSTATDVFPNSSTRGPGGVNPHHASAHDTPAGFAVATMLAGDARYTAYLEARRRGEGRDLLHAAVVRALESRALRALMVTESHARAIAWRLCVFVARERLRRLYSERAALTELSEAW